MKRIMAEIKSAFTQEKIRKGYSLAHRAFKWVLSVTEGYHWLITFSIFSGIFGVVMSLVNVAVSKWIVDVATGAQQGNIYVVAGIVVGSFALGLAARLISPWIFGKINMRISISMQNSLSDALMMTSWKGAGRWHTGDLLTRIGSDASEVLRMGIGIIPNLLVTSLQLIGSFIYLWILDKRLAWFILVATPLVLLSKVYFRKVRELSRRQKEMSSEMGTVMQENLSKRTLVRSLGATEYRKKKLHDTQEKVFQLGMEQIKFSTFTQGVMGVTFGGAYIVAFLWGIFQLYDKEITFGTMTAFLQLVGQVQGPFLSLIAIPPSLVRGWTSVERLMALFEDVEPDEHPELIDRPLTLKFSEVSFGYEDGQKVLDGFSATFLPGHPTAIAGQTGAGKTTIIRLMLALIYPEEGSITLTADDGKSYPVTPDMRINFEYVPQGNTLLSGSIRENLLLGMPGADEETLRKVISLACADFVYELADGLDTKIGENGYGLSEGQAQRIAIARALLRPGHVWLFDEASSALDTETTKKVLDNLLEWGKENTLIFVTHDPRVMDRCEQVINI